MNIKQTIAAIGGPSKVGPAMGITKQAVSLWTQKGRVPAAWHTALATLCRAYNVPVPAEIGGGHGKQ